jgi:hypothetical protein
VKLQLLQVQLARPVQPAQLAQLVQLVHRAQLPVQQARLVRVAVQLAQLVILDQQVQLDQKLLDQLALQVQEVLSEDKVRLARLAHKATLARLAQQDRQQHRAIRLTLLLVTATQVADHSGTTAQQFLLQHLSTLTTLTLQVTQKRCGTKHGTTRRQLTKDLSHSVATQT